ncbi:MAG: thioredoxin family protein [Synergistaceae bacterium]|nr:thioredoxin family protein [Synergistaceae bacterium]
MIDFSQGCSYDQYLLGGYEEERERQFKALGHTVYSPGFEEAVRRVNRPVRVAAFAEIYCPDTVVAMPFVRRMIELNPLIEVFIFERTPYEDILQEYTGTARIPTLLFFGPDCTLLGSYVEHPAALKGQMEKEPEGKNRMVVDLRRGKYNDLIQEELAALLASFAD